MVTLTATLTDGSISPMTTDGEKLSLVPLMICIKKARFEQDLAFLFDMFIVYRMS
jgi:hypothetical protein